MSSSYEVSQVGRYLVAALALTVGCGGSDLQVDSGQCVTDETCPAGQLCESGNCVVPTDAGAITTG